MSLKVSTIMASYLGKYDKCASDRSDKFIRAADSWIRQVHPNKELIIVSDGCSKTISLFEKHYERVPNIYLVTLNKQPMFSGSVRQAGIERATGDIICYLDTDDYITPSHISNIDNRMFEYDYDWCFFSDYLKITNKLTHQRPVSPHLSGLIGTSNIAHLRSMKSSWEGCDGYGHDYVFVQRLKRESKKYDQIYGCGYVVCHLATGLDN
jgi:glycosyltransferase involved in cell wall biosynthesis